MSEFASTVCMKRLHDGSFSDAEAQCRDTTAYLLQRGLVFIALALTAIVIVFSCSSVVLAAERLDLEETTIKGAKELPKVLYIVPWKDSQLGTLGAMAGDGSFDSTMLPLDRYTFRREIKYHLLLQGEREGTSP